MASDILKIWVESPDGARYLVTPINARDMINHLDYKIVRGPRTEDEPAATTISAKTGNDDREDDIDLSANATVVLDNPEDELDDDDGVALSEPLAPSNDLSSVEKVQRTINDMNKAELVYYAHKHYGVELDRRKTEANLKTQILGIAEAAIHSLPATPKDDLVDRPAEPELNVVADQVPEVDLVVPDDPLWDIVDPDDHEVYPDDKPDNV